MAKGSGLRSVRLGSHNQFKNVIFICFFLMKLWKTLENPLDCKEIQPVHSEGDQSWDFFGRNDAKAETLILWPLDAKN